VQLRCRKRKPQRRQGLQDVHAEKKKTKKRWGYGEAAGQALRGYQSKKGGQWQKPEEGRHDGKYKRTLIYAWKIGEESGGTEAGHCIWGGKSKGRATDQVRGIPPRRGSCSGVSVLREKEEKTCPAWEN